MPVSASSYEAKFSECLVTMLANSASFRGLTGAADVAGAKAFIVEDTAGTEAKAVNGAALNTEASWAIVRTFPLRPVERAYLTFGREGDGEIHLFIADTAGDDPDDAMRRARNWVGLIRDELEAQLGVSGRLLYAEFGSTDVVKCDDTGSTRGFHQSTIPVAMRDIP